MAQSIVTVRLNGQPYQMACDPGSEQHIEALASEVDSILQQLKQSAGQVPEARLLAMASLILADKAQASENASDEAENVADRIDTEQIADQIEQAAFRINAITARL